MSFTSRIQSPLADEMQEGLRRISQPRLPMETSASILFSMFETLQGAASTKEAAQLVKEYFLPASAVIAGRIGVADDVSSATIDAARGAKGMTEEMRTLIRSFEERTKRHEFNLETYKDRCDMAFTELGKLTEDEDGVRVLQEADNKYTGINDRSSARIELTNILTYSYAFVINQLGTKHANAALEASAIAINS